MASLAICGICSERVPVENDMFVEHGHVESGTCPASHTAPRSGVELLRMIVENMNATRESFNDGFTVDQLVKIYMMHLASEWVFYPDQWTERQVEEALSGKLPRWNDQEEPIYG